MAKNKLKIVNNCDWLDNTDSLYQDKDRLSKETINRFFNRNFNSDNRLENEFLTCSTSASAFYRTLVEKITSFLYSKFPEYTTENNDVEKFLESKQHVLEQFFYKAIFEYVLYGEVYVKYSNELEFLEINRNPHTVYIDYIEEEGRINNIPVTAIYRDNCEYLLKDNQLYLASEKSHRYYMSLVDNIPFIQYVYTLFVTFENAMAKQGQSVEALRNVLSLPQQNYKDVLEVYSKRYPNLILLTSPTGLDAGKINNGWVNNTPLSNTMDILQKSILWYKNEIIDSLGLTDIFSKVEKDNPSETRVSAENRVNLSTLTWEMKQRKVNNFVLFCLKDYVMRATGIVDDTLSVNALNMVQKEQKNQEEATALSTIMQLIKESKNADEGSAELIYWIIGDISKKAGFSKELNEKIANSIKTNEANKKQMAENPPPDYNLEMLKSQIALNNAKIQETQSKSWVNSSKLTSDEVDREKTKADIEQNQQKLNIEKEDADQQLIDAERRIEERGL